MSSYAPAFFRRLNGVFSVYKPSNMGQESFCQAITAKLLEDLKGMIQRPEKKMIVFDPPLNQTSKLQASNKLMTTETFSKPVCVPDWFDHPLVQRPRYTHRDFNITSGHSLDHHSCGVQLIGFQNGAAQTLKRYKHALLPRTYRVECELGLATLSYTGESKVVERSTWHHVTAEKVDRVLTNIQAAHRNACILGLGLDLSSQKAYEMAAQGSLLKPSEPSGTIALDIKLVEFKAPKFVFDIIIFNESCRDVRKLVHEIGVILKSNAICTKLRRLQDGPVHVEDSQTLLIHQISVNNVLSSMAHFRKLVTPDLLKRKTHFTSQTVEISQMENSDSDLAKKSPINQ